MKAVFISDTHEQHEKLVVPEGDLLVHCGDWTWRGNFDAIKTFLDWFSSQPHPYKCLLGGNHELGLDVGFTREPKLELIDSFCQKTADMHYLENSSVTIQRIKIYGSPITPFFYNWAWNRHRGPAIAKYWAEIPEDTNVLITHGPPMGILDLVEDQGSHVGCQDLKDRIKQLSNLKVHAFGHIHDAYGSVYQDGVTYVNAAMCDEDYKINRKPIVVEI